MRRRNLIVVDDFYPDPDAVRSYAMEQQFERLGGKNWPGRDSAKSVSYTHLTLPTKA